MYIKIHRTVVDQFFLIFESYPAMKLNGGVAVAFQYVIIFVTITFTQQRGRPFSDRERHQIREFIL